MVEEKEPILEVTVLCKTLGVSRSGFYSWKKKPACQRRQETIELTKEVKQIFHESRGTYGVPRIQKKLEREGKRHGRSRIGKIMKKEGLSAKPKKKWVKTTDSNHNLPIAPRILQVGEQETLPVKPNEVWVSDLTYIPTQEGWLYLVIFLDLFTRKVVGYQGADHMREEMVLAALRMGIRLQGIKMGSNLVAHSDRGSQYAAKVYRRYLKLLGIQASMSRRGNCYDNAFAESFFHSLKTELIYKREFETREEAMSAIFEYIEVWYNRNRLHSSLGYRTPVEYEEAYRAA